MHAGRVAYYVVGEGIVSDPPPLAGAAAAMPARVPGLAFGRMFGRTRCEFGPEERVVRKLTELGRCMNDPTAECGEPAQKDADESDIPAGYTYLGQFIAHEVTHDSTGDLLRAGLKPENLSTPQVDLDSLYGGGPKLFPGLYEKDGMHLRIGETAFVPKLNKSFPNDLPRGAKDDPKRGVKDDPKHAAVADPRNDENLALAQTHVAFITFHNKIVDKLIAADKNLPASQVFERAREQVIRHFQWIVLNDFLPRLVREDVLDCVQRHGRRWFRGDDALFMPLEFSAAAFRIGHSMVRDTYEWNPYHRTDGQGNNATPLSELFKQAGFIKGGLAGHNSLPSDWVIDWRHFYDFGPLGHVRPVPKMNNSARLDTVFDLHLDAISGFPDQQLDRMQRAITVRNLLRGFYLGLPTGEEVARRMGETPLSRKQLAEGPHEKVLDDPVFWGKTPLWYYILKEAELLGKRKDGTPANRLGPVGGRIVAETLITLVERSPYSILADGWQPTLGRPATAAGPARFEMIDLLDFAGVVDPVAKFIRENFPYIDLGEGQQALPASA